MSDIFYPDVSAFQAGASLKGAPLVVARASEGAWLADSAYQGFGLQAANLKIPFFAYHFLEGGSAPELQAQFCHRIVGGTPLMLDFEPTGSSVPDVSHAAWFVRDFRALGGTCWMLYFPDWYWQQLGKPDTSPLWSLGLKLVSSDYTSYSDTGPGWAPYGSPAAEPAVWQYTDSHDLNGTQVDFNAYRGSMADLDALWHRGQVAAPTAQNPVAGLAVTRRGFTSLDVAWDGQSAATGYLVKWYWRGALKGKLNTTSPSAHIGHLSTRSTYEIRVRAQPGGSQGADASIKATTR
jgi:hypothetical protein